MEDMKEGLNKIQDMERKEENIQTSIGRMKYDLHQRLCGWMTQESVYGTVDCSDVVEKVMHHAPHALLRSRDELKDVIVGLWAINRELSVDDYAELDDKLSLYFE